MAEGVEGEDVPKLNPVVAGDLLFQAVDLVLEPFLVIVATFALFLQVLLHLLQAFLRG